MGDDTDSVDRPANDFGYGDENDRMCDAFADWMSNYGLLLEAGLPVDFGDLRSRLNAAFANSFIDS